MDRSPGPPVFRECFKCKFDGVTTATQCPKCGRKLYGPKEIRTRGVLQVITGLFLVVLMGGITIFVTTFLASRIQDPTASKEIRQQTGTLLAIYAIFGFVIVFGLHGLIMGIWQIVTGRRSRVLIWIMWALLFGLMFVAGAFMAISK